MVGVALDQDKITKIGAPADQIPTNKFAYNLLSQFLCSQDCIFVMTTHSRKAVIVGGGPVGCLSAMGLARMGWDVEIYEGRPGLRHHAHFNFFWMLTLEMSRHASPVIQSTFATAINQSGNFVTGNSRPAGD